MVVIKECFAHDDPIDPVHLENRRRDLEKFWKKHFSSKEKNVKSLNNSEVNEELTLISAEALNQKLLEEATNINTPLIVPIKDTPFFGGFNDFVTDSRRQLAEKINAQEENKKIDCVKEPVRKSRAVSNKRPSVCNLLPHTKEGPEFKLDLSKITKNSRSRQKPVVKRKKCKEPPKKSDWESKAKTITITGPPSNCCTKTNMPVKQNPKTQDPKKSYMPVKPSATINKVENLSRTQTNPTMNSRHSAMNLRELTIFKMEDVEESKFSKKAKEAKRIRMLKIQDINSSSSSAPTIRPIRNLKREKMQKVSNESHMADDEGSLGSFIPYEMIAKRDGESIAHLRRKMSPKKQEN